MERIKRVSAWLRWLFMAALAGAPVLDALFWMLATPALLAEPGAVGVSCLSGLPVSDPLPWSARLLALGASLLPLAANMAALYFLARLFRLYACGEIFTRRNVRCIRFVGYAVLARQAVDPFFQALVSASLTLHNPAGERVVALGLSDANLTALVTGLVVLLVSWVMDEGRRLQEADALVI